MDGLHKTYDLVRLISMSLIAFICLVALLTILFQQKENKALFDNLEHSNTNLEIRVAERTQELESINEELIQSMEEVQALIQDIELQNQRLEELLEEMRFLYDHAPCGYHTVDGQGKILKINHTELDWFGYSENEVIGESVSRFMTEEALKRRLVLVEKLKFTDRLNNVESEFVRKDGSIFPVMLNMVSYRDDKGNYLMHRSSVFDISQTHMLRKQLEESNSYLTHLNEEKNRFMGIVSHDLKNPIHGILGLLQLIRHPNNLNQDQVNYVRIIEEITNKMKALITKLLDFNRIEQSTLLEEMDFDLDIFLDETMRTFEGQAEKKKIHLSLEKTSEPIQMKTDMTMFGQVLDNLVSNAIKFSEPGTNVWVRAKKTDGQLLIEVEDQGPGFHKEEVTKIFGSFQMFSARPTAGESSTGLGLSIVKKIMLALGGDVQVKSEWGKGALFTAILPCKI